MLKLHTKNSKPLLIILVLLSLIGLYVLFLSNNSKKEIPDYAYKKQLISIGGTKITADVADTPYKQQLGLGKRDFLDDDSGMLFPYSKKTIPYFWMKDMLIPIDIIWIADQKIVGIEKSVPNLSSDTPDFRLPTYSPPTPIDYVLEVNAGFSDRNGIKVGDELKI